MFLVWLAACALAALFVHDRWFSGDNILRNFPVLGRFRYFLIEIGPELRQYIVAGNHEELPFNREERDWIYRTARGENNYFGFGTDDQLYNIGYPVIKHAVFPHGEVGFTASIHDKLHEVPCAKTLGEIRDRAKAWRPRSIVNISAMSFGALGAHAVEALNRGAKTAGCYHNTGEGGISPHHKHGADVIYQIGTGYFGCRNLDGGFSMDKLLETLGGCPQVRGIEIKLSQGAKPGKGGVLPGAKVTEEIAGIRGVRAGTDCVSPNNHGAFRDIRGMIAFIEEIAAATGLPVGIKSAVGHTGFWRELAAAMREGGKGPDWITIDGGEGGTGAAPLTFADHVSLPFRVAFPRVYKEFLDAGAADRTVWIASAKLGFPDRAIVAFCLGADLINIAREAMLSIGCIQAQKCHTDLCPSGVATHSAYLQRGLAPEVQSQRFARFCQSFRNELLAVTHACGYEHPSQFTAEDVEVSAGPGQFKSLRELYGYTPGRTWSGIAGWGVSAA
ncbi:MAG: FMN-binding glutamate synthase family protein [Elusimicrobia bacterium]|nr:FMN-binding glutamate synthase family protein [Elusimicrobiota bacterium]